MDVARYVAKGTPVTPRTRSNGRNRRRPERETLISNDQVKFIVATYSITDARKQKVDFAGPYLLTGQSLLVKSDNTDIVGGGIVEQQAVLGLGIHSGTAHQGQVPRRPTSAVRHLLGVRGSVAQRGHRRGHHRRGHSRRVRRNPGEFKIVSEAVLRALRHWSEEGGLRTSGQDQRRAGEDGGRRRLEGGLRQEPRSGRTDRAGTAGHRRILIGIDFDAASLRTVTRPWPAMCGTQVGASARVSVCRASRTAGRSRP